MPGRSVRLLLLSLVLLFLLSATWSPRAATAQGAVTVQIGKNAALVDGGQAARLEVTVTCAPSTLEVLEAFIYVVQEDQTSQFTGVLVTCDGRPHTATVLVRAFSESPFQRGKALASAHVLLLDPATGATVSDGDSRTIKLK
jgi:hypothetical protein